MNSQKYIIIKNKYLDEFTNSVNNAINNGYKPLGGITISDCHKGQFKFYQSMIKEML